MAVMASLRHFLLGKHEAPELEPEPIEVLVGSEITLRPSRVLEGVQAQVHENRRVGMDLARRSSRRAGQ